MLPDSLVFSDVPKTDQEPQHYIMESDIRYNIKEKDFNIISLNVRSLNRDILKVINLYSN